MPGNEMHRGMVWAYTRDACMHAQTKKDGGKREGKREEKQELAQWVTEWVTECVTTP